MSEFWKATLVRAIRTMAQAAITLIGSDMVNIVSLDWPSILGCTATMGVLSILTSIATGLPEVACADELTTDEVAENHEVYVGDMEEDAR